MFIKTGYLHLTHLFPITIVVRLLVSQPRSPGFKTATWLQDKPHLLILPRSIKWVPGTPGEWVVENKLSPLSGSVVLRQLNPIHKKGYKVFHAR